MWKSNTKKSRLKVRDGALKTFEMFCISSLIPQGLTPLPIIEKWTTSLPLGSLFRKGEPIQAAQVGY